MANPAALALPRLRREATKNSRLTARQSRSLLLLFGALLRCTQKRPRLLADKSLITNPAQRALPRLRRKYTKNSRLTARQSRSLLLLFGALLRSTQKRPRLLAAF